MFSTNTFIGFPKKKIIKKQQQYVIIFSVQKIFSFFSSMGKGEISTFVPKKLVTSTKLYKY